MNTGISYSPSEMFFWTLQDTIRIVLWASIPSILFFCGFKLCILPLSLISIVGVATSFIVGFRNSATYDRTWEGRKIWGGIVNTSRSFAMSINDFVQANDILDQSTVRNHQLTLLNRHFAWLTALRHQLRAPKIWEAIHLKHNKTYQEKNYRVLEWDVPLEVELKRYLNTEELQQVSTKSNKASFLLSLQSSHLKKLQEQGNIDLFHQIELQNLIYHLYDHEGKSERIKNFPYPRQYTSISKYLVTIFIGMVPFGLIQEFDKLAASSGAVYAPFFIFAAIPASSLIMWIFKTLDRVGESSENPFEGSANDVPITTMSFGIENDCRDIMGMDRIVPPVNYSKIVL